ncbi:hypothetical protein [Amycolatopsis sp. WAC 04182]|uniref:hypothetical protein n=1 Tax=Amycolatopsis sp. WAC 04182 TaxID=2203198 RepID=UPI000F793490|nr:hypothetical protein [Amycolatopsis sp. WAC 04182]
MGGFFSCHESAYSSFIADNHPFPVTGPGHHIVDYSERHITVWSAFVQKLSDVTRRPDFWTPRRAFGQNLDKYPCFW